jgi:outer membrane protein assembly factor BamB
MSLMRSVAGAALGISLLAASPAGAQTATDAAWPQFRGPNASGIAEAPISPPLEFGPQKNLLWKTLLPAGHSSPAIWGSRIFLTAFDAQTKKLEVIGLDRKTGQILWRQPIPSEEFEKVHQLSSPATATPAVDGERVYSYFGSYGVVAHDLDGKVVWEARLPLAQVPFGSGTSPIVVGDRVIVNRHDPKDAFLIALDRNTGRTVWKHQHEPPPPSPAPFASYSTPLVAQQQIVIHGPRRIEAFDIATGEPRWWVPVISTGTSTPVLANDTIYVATWFPLGESDQTRPLPDFATLLRNDKNGNGFIDQVEFPADLPLFSRPDIPDVPGATGFVKGFFARFDVSKDGELQKDEWDAGVATFGNLAAEHGLLAVKIGGTGDVTGTHLLWKESKAIPEVPSPLAYRNRIYMVRNGGIVTSLDAGTGRVLYRARVGAAGPYYASPVAQNGRLLVASGDGVVSVLAAGDRLNVLARNDLGEPVLATPAIVNGVLYVRTASGLSAFGQK